MSNFPRCGWTYPASVYGALFHSTRLQSTRNVHSHCPDTFMSMGIRILCLVLSGPHFGPAKMVPIRGGLFQSFPRNL